MVHTLRVVPCLLAVAVGAHGKYLRVGPPMRAAPLPPTRWASQMPGASLQRGAPMAGSAAHAVANVGGVPSTVPAGAPMSSYAARSEPRGSGEGAAQVPLEVQVPPFDWKHVEVPPRNQEEEASQPLQSVTDAVKVSPAEDLNPAKILLSLGMLSLAVFVAAVASSRWRRIAKPHHATATEMSMSGLSQQKQLAVAAFAGVEKIMPGQSITALTSGWGMEQITPDGELMQRVEGNTRRTWKFNDYSRDRLQVALNSDGRPVHADVQLWIGPNWSPFTLKAYSEDGKARPIQTLIGTRNKAAMIEVKNNGEHEFPISGAADYATDDMARLPQVMPEAIEGVRCDGGALRTFSMDPSVEQVELLLRTEGKQLNARIELLQGPNNAKQTFEVFTNNGELNSLCVCFNVVGDDGCTVLVRNIAPMEFPCSIHINAI